VGLLVTLVTTPWFFWLAVTGRDGASPLHGYTAAGLAPLAVRTTQYCKELTSLREYTSLMVSQLLTDSQTAP